MTVRGALVIVGMLAGCSQAFTTELNTTTGPKPCSTRVAVADTAIGGALGGGAMGAFAATVFSERSDQTAPAVATGLLAIGSAFYFWSAAGGFNKADVCRREVLAQYQMRPDPRVELPKPVVAFGIEGRTCEQRRLDMYSRAVGSPDPAVRIKMLVGLPTCEEAETREQAWKMTRMAALAAGAGKCDDIEMYAREIYKLDVVLHDVVLLADVEIKYCLQRNAL